MKINLSLNNLVEIDRFILKTNGLKYEHTLFIAEDINLSNKYYLIDYIVNKDNIDKINNTKQDVLLEELYIVNLSIKKNIPLQIALFLKEAAYIEDKDMEECLLFLKNIDISFFEVRYDFYKEMRDVDVVVGEILLNYYKVQLKSASNDIESIFEHLDLSKLKRLLNLK